MNNEQKIKQLRNIIFETLAPIIGKKVALLGLPGHGNIGDTYISLGEFSLLKEIGVKCIYKKLLVDDANKLPSLPEDCTILMQGGGDFGDIWRGIQEARLTAIRKYKNHRIIIFPQTVFYLDLNNLKQDARLLEDCPDLIICARDKKSYEILSGSFKNKILLVPDMAFFIPVKYLRKFMAFPSKKSLYLKRIDKELNNCNYTIENISQDIKDWPTAQNSQFIIRLFFRFVGITDAFYLRKMFSVSEFIRKLSLFYLQWILYPYIAKTGVQFLSAYNVITVTRMHAAILAVLLNKPVNLVNNSYGKNKNFYDSWLTDLDTIHLIN